MELDFITQNSIIYVLMAWVVIVVITKALKFEKYGFEIKPYSLVYKNKGVKFISLLLEDPQEPEAIERAKEFLIKQQAKFNHYFMNENLMQSFEKLDLLGIPAVFVYAQDGELMYRLTGDNPNKQFTEIDVENAIKKALEN